MLVAIENFADEGLSNIFDGALIPQIAKDSNLTNHYKVIGCRLESDKPENVRVLKGSCPDSRGVYAATVYYDSHKRRSRNRQAFFFPRDWTKEIVINAIAEAFRNKYLIDEAENQFIGLTSSGIMVTFWLDGSGKIIDAMPLREGSLTTKGGRVKRATDYCRQCGWLKHSICSRHNQHFKQFSFKNLPKQIRYYSRKFYFNLARKLRLVE